MCYNSLLRQYSLEIVCVFIYSIIMIPCLFLYCIKNQINIAKLIL